MTNYTNTMREALKSMYISEDNIAMLRDIVKRKSAKSIKFADGTMKVDLFTASAVIQALDKVNPATKAKITKLINTGKKANFMSVAKVVMKSENDPEIKEEVSLETEEVSLLAQQAAILISKRERERNPRKEQVQLDEEMNPTDHVKKKGDKYCVYNADGSIAKEFDNEEDANRYAIDNHDSLMGEEVKLDELMPPSRHVGKSKKNPDMFCVFDTNGKEVKLFKDEDDAKEYAVKNHEALMGHDKPKKEEDDLDEAVGKDWQKAVDTLSKKMSAIVASGAKGKIITFVSYNGV